jgi:hypothetical protein
MFCITREMIGKTRLIFLTVIVASLTFGIAAAMTAANTFPTQSASAQSTGGTPTYGPPPSGNSSSGSSGNSTSGNGTK